jgi:hypothetical protein
MDLGFAGARAVVTGGIWPAVIENVFEMRRESRN